jgi:ankyrin repeat protein
MKNAFESDKDENKEKIEYLETQLQIVLKKLSNANQLCIAQEKAAKEAKDQERRVYKDCQTYKYKLSKTQEKLDTLERRIQMKQLKKSCHEMEKDISMKQSRCKEIEFDDTIHQPIKTDTRIELALLKKSLQKSENIHESQWKLYETLVERQSLDSKLKRAAIAGDVSQIQALMNLDVSVNSPDETGLSPFKYACGQGHVDAVRVMMSVADVNNKDGRWTALHIALEHSQPEIVTILIKNNANVEEPDETCEVPLHIACRKGSFECISTLVHEGKVSVNTQNKLGDTALHYCARTNQYEIASFLLENGADLKIKNADGLTPFIIAKTKRKYEVMKVLNSIQIISKE